MLGAEQGGAVIDTETCVIGLKCQVAQLSFRDAEACSRSKASSRAQDMSQNDAPAGQVNTTVVTGQ